MKKITATVIYPVNLTVEVPDNATTDEKREIVLKAAKMFFPHPLDTPIIHDSSDDDLID